MGRSVLRALIAGCALALAASDPARLARPCFLGSASAAEEEWAAEFDAVCARTQDAMTLTADELRSLIARCDSLAPRLASLDPSRRKVYAKRLQQCRDLYAFVLASRDSR